MCSHILSDIEVLCDRVAILKKGKLAQVGLLNDLRQQTGNQNLVEIIATGITAENFLAHFPNSEKFTITETASGLSVHVPQESDVDEVIAALRKAQGKLVSVQPIRQSLEELFVD
jgi:ABC-2 type transport system ATP-binding protein